MGGHQDSKMKPGFRAD